MKDERKIHVQFRKQFQNLSILSISWNNLWANQIKSTANSQIAWIGIYLVRFWGGRKNRRKKILNHGKDLTTLLTYIYHVKKNLGCLVDTRDQRNRLSNWCARVSGTKKNTKVLHLFQTQRIWEAKVRLPNQGVGSDSK